MAIKYVWGIDKGQIGSTFEKVETYAMNWNTYYPMDNIHYIRSCSLAQQPLFSDAKLVKIMFISFPEGTLVHFNHSIIIQHLSETRIRCTL